MTYEWASFKRKKNWRSQGGEGVRTVVLGSRKGAIFHYVTALFVFSCKLLCVLYRATPCFNSNKNRSAMEHRGFEHGSPRQEPSDIPVRRTLVCDSMGNKLIYILLLKRALHWRTRVIHPFLFNPQLNFVISISPS